MAEIVDPKGVEIPGIELIDDINNPPAPDPGTQKGDEKDKKDITEPGDDKKLPEKVNADLKDDKKDPDPKASKGDEKDDVADDEPLISTIAKQIGYELGEDEEFEDSYEGIAKFVESAATRRADEQLGEFFQQYPKAGEYFDWLVMGGNPDDFFKTQAPEVDLSSLDIKSEEVQKSVLRSFYRKNDYTDEEITEALSDLEASGLIEKESKRALGKLQLIQQKEQAALIEQQKQAAAQRQTEIKTHWKNIETTIDKGVVKGLQIPEKEKKELFKYMAAPVKAGKSQEMLDAEQDDFETRVALAFLRKNKFDLTKYVNAVAGTKKAESLKDMINRKSEKLKSGDPRNLVNKDTPEIDLKYMQD